MVRRITYPYTSSPTREAEIRENWSRVMRGMTDDEVSRILGLADDHQPLYEPKMKRPHQIGWTSWYIVQRLRERGSSADSDEKLVRVTFDMAGRVTKVDAWGL